MIKWEAWVHTLDTNNHVVMIRNHKTSYGLVRFSDQRQANQQAVKINAYPFARKVELYKQAMREEIVALRHDDMDFASNQLKRITIEKGEKCYGVLVWINGRQWIVKKEKYKKDAKTWLDNSIAEHGEDGFIEGCKAMIERKRLERLSARR